MDPFLQLVQDLQLGSIGKGLTLVVLFLFLLAIFIIFSSVRTLNRVLVIRKSAASLLIQGFALLYVFTAIFLFLVALAIL